MIDWAALGEVETSEVLRATDVDTTNPPGNERDGAAFLAGILDDRGNGERDRRVAPGRANLMPGSTRRSLPATCSITHRRGLRGSAY